jgi:alkylation response protein AidB-like acyl-CoA dehydrogenase
MGQTGRRPRYLNEEMNQARPVLFISARKRLARDDAGREAGNLGVQVHGGIGFTWEHDLHLFYRRSKSNEILFGDATFHRDRIAAMVIDEGMAAAT